MLPLFLYSLIISVGGDLFAATVPVFSDYICRWRSVRCHCG